MEEKRRLKEEILAGETIYDKSEISDNIDMPESESYDLPEEIPEESEYSEDFQRDIMELEGDEEPPDFTNVKSTPKAKPVPPEAKINPDKLGAMKKNELVEQCMKTKEYVPKFADHNKTWFRDKKVADLKAILVEMTDSINKEHQDLEHQYTDTTGKRIGGNQGELLFMVHQMLIVSAEGYSEMHKDKMKGVSIKGLSNDLEEHKEELGNILADNMEYLTGWTEDDLQYFLTPPLRYAMFMLKIGNGRVIKNKLESELKKT